MEGGFNKKGLSPVIASVLMILLVIILASMIFLWARGFVGEQIEKFGQPIENLCESVDFVAQVVSGTSTKYALEIVNRGDIDIFHLDIKMFLGGNSEIGKFNFNVDAHGAPIKGDIDLKMDSGEEPGEIEIYPALIGTVKGKHSNKVFTCNDVSQTIQL
jgi:flagellin-like protein